MTRVQTTSLETYLGHYVDYLNPRAEDIDLVDVARGLAHTCRFAGQTSRFYSVAEHAVLVARIVAQTDGHPGPGLALAALHHDSHEAYLGDWPTPLKQAFGLSGVLGEMSDGFDRAVAERFGINAEYFKHPVVKSADLKALFNEAAVLKASRGLGDHWGNYTIGTPVAGAGLPPEYAERLFVEAHFRYGGKP